MSTFPDDDDDVLPSVEDIPEYQYPEDYIPDIEDTPITCENCPLYVFKYDCDEFILAIEWTATPEGGKLTIHGIWAVDKLGKAIKSQDRPYSPSKFSPELLAKLDEHWPDAMFQEPSSLRMHEFHKHAICLGPPNCQIKYFELGLKMHLKFDIQSILAEAGIYPDPEKKISTVDVKEAIRLKTGFEPGIVTEMMGKAVKYRGLKWILIGFDKEGENVVPFKGNTPDDDFIWKPKFPDP